MQTVIKHGFLPHVGTQFKCEDFDSALTGKADLLWFHEIFRNCNCHLSKHIEANIVASEVQYFILNLIESESETTLNPEGTLKIIASETLKKFGEHGFVVLFTNDGSRDVLYEVEDARDYLIHYNFSHKSFLNKRDFPKCQERIELIMDTFPNMWSRFGKRAWKPFVDALFDGIRDVNFPIDFVKKIGNNYASKKPYMTLIDAYGNYFRLGLLTELEHADVLGLPFIPEGECFDFHNRVLEALHDPLKTIETTRRWNKGDLERFKMGVSIVCQTSTPEVMNHDNLIGEEIIEYPPMQIYRTFTPNGKIYQFTLREISDIMSRGTNPYTLEKIETTECLKSLLSRPKSHLTGPVSQLLSDILSPSELL